jgi:hypothetical protein
MAHLAGSPSFIPIRTINPYWQVSTCVEHYHTQPCVSVMSNSKDTSNRFQIEHQYSPFTVNQPSRFSLSESSNLTSPLHQAQLLLLQPLGISKASQALSEKTVVAVKR